MPSACGSRFSPTHLNLSPPTPAEPLNDSLSAVLGLHGQPWIRAALSTAAWASCLARSAPAAWAALPSFGSRFSSRHLPAPTEKAAEPFAGALPVDLDGAGGGVIVGSEAWAKKNKIASVDPCEPPLAAGISAQRRLRFRRRRTRAWRRSNPPSALAAGSREQAHRQHAHAGDHDKTHQEQH